MLASKPPAGDPREVLYNMATAGVGIMGTVIQEASTPQPESAPRQNSPRPTTAARDPPRDGDARNTVTQARVDRAR
jgi:hypothetical protein